MAICRLPWPFSTNLYGPHDRFNTKNRSCYSFTHQEILRCSEIRCEVVIWGDGTAQRDFLYVLDAVRALVLLMDKAEGVVNLVVGKTQSIKEAVTILANLTGTHDRVRWDASMPNGQVFRAYDASKLKELGFSCNYDIERGLKKH